MSNIDRTPGEWVAGPYAAVWTGIAKDMAGKWDEAVNGSAQIIATIDNPSDRHLVAAAPDLFEALVACVGRLERLGDISTAPLLMANAALLKARGA